MVASGMRREEIAAKLGCTMSTLQVRCSQNKISLRPPGPRRKRTRVELDALAQQRKIRKALREASPVEIEPELTKEFRVRLVNYKLKVDVEQEALALLVMRAEKLGTTVDLVAKRLLETIARENLYDAVIDEAA
jgi:hypothetical protein